MKKFLIATFCALALLGAPALAADMPVKAPPSVAAPVFNWTGFYVGGTLGYGWGDTIQIGDAGDSGFHRWSGIAGGATAGVNWQSGVWMLGIETDFSWSDIKAHWGDAPGWGCASVPGTAACINKVEWFGTTRGRIGYAFDRFLPYATLGAAYARLHGQWGTACNTAACFTSTRSGLAYGGGFEWAFAPNWSAKVEYLRIDLAATDFESHGGDPLKIGKPRFDVVRAGLTYRFGDPWGKAPVVAKY